MGYKVEGLRHCRKTYPLSVVWRAEIFIYVSTGSHSHHFEACSVKKRHLLLAVKRVLQDVACLDGGGVVGAAVVKLKVLGARTPPS